MTDINILKILFGVLSGISLCIFIIVFLLFNKKINKEKKDIEKSKEYLDILFNKKGLVNSDYNDCLNQIKNNNNMTRSISSFCG